MRVPVPLIATGLCLWVATSMPPAGAADPPNSTGPKAPGTEPAADQAARRVPPPPGTGTPVDTWRELLQMNPAERAKALADRTEHQRKYLEDQLREYEALSANEREARLNQLEQTYYLGELIRMQPARRQGWLDAVKPQLRPVIDQRLAEWDRLSPKVQQDILEYETTATYFFRVRPPGGPPTAASPAPPLVSRPPPEEKPGKWTKDIGAFLALSPAEQAETLRTLNPAEREEMEGTLKLFARLPPDQRKICIDSFERFHRLSKEQREQFLQNAARWKAMSPRERATWRTLVEILPPPSSAPASDARPVTASNSGGR